LWKFDLAEHISIKDNVAFIDQLLLLSTEVGFGNAERKK
jgi:hypothetical protein